MNYKDNTHFLLNKGDKLQQDKAPICLYCKNAYRCDLEIRADETISWGIFNHKTPMGEEEVLFELKEEYKNDKFLVRQIENSYLSDYKKAKESLKFQKDFFSGVKEK